ncbi:EsaB/YukD family protein [Zhihengliuella halotolerans]|uniref:EsaB/YukD family protein n=1 Tax=Zhihengliuella halotolerans TaxID=370736 RepID=UPI000C8099E5|nr:EsaB/YukD family protein [Zhihengliuella halotolerans]
MSAGYTRVTIATPTSNIETLLPSDQELGALMPDILRIAGAAPGAGGPRELTLTPVGAASLAPQVTLSAAGIRDGAVLRLDRRDEAVPNPVVYDLAEETEHFAADSPDRGTFEASRLVSTVVVAVLGIAALILATGAAEPEVRLGGGVTLAALALLGVAVVPRGRLACDVELLALSAGAIVAIYVLAPVSSPWAAWLAPAWTALALIAWQAGRRSPGGALVTSATAVVLGVLWAGGLQIWPEPGAATAVAGVGTAFLLGFAPRLALGLSGMNALHDAVARGERPGVARARRAYRDAHQGLVGAAVLCALSLAAASHGLLTRDVNGWGIALAVLLIVVTGLRARNLPLALERAVLLGAAAFGTAVLAYWMRDAVPVWLLGVALLALAFLPLVLRPLEVPEHVAASLRLNARRAEAIATVALLPVLLGVFDLYPQLAETF